MDTICFDKTGTLTENRLRLVRVTDADGTVHRVRRAAARTAAPTDRGPRLSPARRRLRAAPGPRHRRGRPGRGRPDEEWTQLEGLPFEAGRGYAAAVGHPGDGSPVLVLKGAPETVLPACADLPATPPTGPLPGGRRPARAGGGPASAGRRR